MAKNLTEFNKLDDKEKQEYEASVKQFYKILIFATFFYYVVPTIVIFSCGKVEKLAIMILEFMLYNVFTLFSFMANFLHAKNHGFKLFVPIGIAVFFIPVAIIYYPPVAVLYSLMYFVIGMFGQLSGNLMLKRKKCKRQPIGLNNLINKKQPKGKKNKSNTASKDAGKKHK